MQKLKEIVYVPVSKVFRDEQQPRQYFDPVKLSRLGDSIKKLGIREPLTVEDMKDGTYKIVDGERRWRAAQAVGLKEVPVLIEKSLTAHDRVIEQFHLQELREGWQADEKAIAINSLSQVLGVSFTQAADMVGINRKLAEIYRAVMKLMNRDEFLKNKLPLELAQSINAVVATAKNQTQKQLDQPLDESEVKDLETAIIKSMIVGTTRNRSDLLSLRDAIVKDAKSVQRFIKGASAVTLFKATNAADVKIFRKFANTIQNMGYIISAVGKSKTARGYLEQNKDLQTQIRYVTKHLQELV